MFQGRNGTFDWTWKDGNKAVFFVDRDGTLTGMKKAAVVPNFPLYDGPLCQKRSDWGNMLVCPYRYIKVSIIEKFCLL